MSQIEWDTTEIRGFKQSRSAHPVISHPGLVGVKAQLAEVEGTMAARNRMLEDAQTTLISTQFEKARHEARVDAAEKKLTEIKAARKTDREAYDAKIKHLELQVQKAQNDLAAANEKRKANDRHLDDPTRPSPAVNQPCNCTVA